jgi:hypothetical protein
MYYSITERRQETVILSKYAGRMLLNDSKFHNSLPTSSPAFNILRKNPVCALLRKFS